MSDLGDVEWVEKAFEFTINGKEASLDTVINANDVIEAIQKPQEGETRITLILSNGEEYEPEIDYFVIPDKGLTLKQIAEGYFFPPNMTFDFISNYYTWYVNGELATADTVIPAGAEIKALYDTTKPMPQPDMLIEISIQFSQDHYGTATIPFYGRTEITLGELYEIFVWGETDAPSFTSYIWIVNGSYANADTVIKNGYDVNGKYLTNKEEETTTVIVTGVSGNQSYTQELSIPTSSATLKDLSDEFGGTPEEMFNPANYAWYVNGEAATADTVVKGGDIITVVMLRETAKEPGEGEMKITVTDYEPSWRESMTQIIILPNAEISLKDAFETYIAPGTSFDKVSEQYTWYVNGEPASGETMITNGAHIIGVYSSNGDNGGENGGSTDNPSIDIVAPAVPEPETVTLIFSQYGMVVTEPFSYIYPEEMTLAMLLQMYLQGSFEEIYSQYNWYVNGQLATPETVIRNGVTILAQELEETPAPEVGEGEILIELQAYNPGDKQAYAKLIVPAGITIADFIKSYLQVELPELLKTYIMTVDGKPVQELSPDTALNTSVKIELKSTAQSLNILFAVSYDGIVAGKAYNISGAVALPLESFLYAYADMGESISRFLYFVNGELASLDTMITDGDIVLGVAVGGGNGGSGNHPNEGGDIENVSYPVFVIIEVNGKEYSRLSFEFGPDQRPFQLYPALKEHLSYTGNLPSTNPNDKSPSGSRSES